MQSCFFFAFVALSLTFSSCKKDAIYNAEEELLQINNSAKEHSEVAKVFSVMVTSSNFMDLVYSEVKNSPVADYNAVPLLNLLQGSNAVTLKAEFSKATKSLENLAIDFEYFINEYIQKNPGLSLSFPDESMVKNRSTEIFVFSEDLHER